MHGWKIIFSKTERTTMRALASSLALCLASTAAFADKAEEECKGAKYRKDSALNGGAQP